MVLLGASGRVGRLLCPAFVSKMETINESLTIYPQFRTNPPDNNPHWFHWRSLDSPSRVSEVAADISAKIGAPPDAVLCLAGVTPTSPQGQMEDNTRLAHAAFKLAQALKSPRLFLTSSSAVYGRPRGPNPLREQNTPAPMSPYGHAKLAMEQAAKGWAAQTPNAPHITCLRIGNVAGTDQLLLNAASPHAVMLDRFANGQTPLRSYIGPITLAQVIASLLRAKTLPDLLNIAAPKPVFMADLLASAKTGWTAQEAPPEALAKVCLDTNLLQNSHKFTPVDSNPDEMIRQIETCKERA